MNGRGTAQPFRGVHGFQSTRRCVQCFARAVMWKGYVSLPGGVAVLAGWCQGHAMERYPGRLTSATMDLRADSGAPIGPYDERMGLWPAL
ncbi:MAG: hypothetical protein ACHQ50_17075 [Fimbriimonadales bacterium]